MFIHNINPVLLDLGFLQVRYYGLVYFLGFLFIYFYMSSQVKKDKVKGLDKDKLEVFMIYLLAGIVLGARVFTFIFYSPGVLLSNPLELFMVWRGGMSFHGGLIGAILAVYFFSKKHNVKFYSLADLLALPAFFFLALGRIANFVNGELPGTRSDVPWCVVFQGFEGCRHPYQLYAAAKDFFLTGILFFVARAWKLKQGLLFWYFVLLYNSTRFLLDFLRDPAGEAIFLGVSTGQYLSLFFTIIAIYFVYKINKK